MYILQNINMDIYMDIILSRNFWFQKEPNWKFQVRGMTTSQYHITQLLYYMSENLLYGAMA